MFTDKATDKSSISSFFSSVLNVFRVLDFLILYIFP